MFFKPKTKEPEYDVKKHIDSNCEVLTENNQVLFVGIVRGYTPKTKELTIGLQRGTSSHEHILYNTPIKVRVLPNKYSDPITFLYAKTLRFIGDEWIVEFDHAVCHEDRRENFRLRVAIDGLLYCMDPDLGRECAVPCQLIDISVTGVLLECPRKFEVGQEFDLHLSELRPGGEGYRLTCQVRRLLANTHYSYGCAFQGLKPKQEQQLYQDLFALQSKTLKSMVRQDDE